MHSSKALPLDPGLNKSKLYILCASFTSWEWLAAEKFISSPYFVENEKVVKLFGYMKKCLIYEQATSKKTAYTQVFGKQPFNDAKLRHLMSDLLLALEEFLVVQEVKNNKVSFKLKLLDIYNSRKLNKHFNTTVTATKKMLKSQTNRDALHYYQVNQAEIGLYQNYLLQRRRTTTDSLQQAIDSMDVFYIASKLKYCCAILNYQNIIESVANIALYDEILNYVDQSEILEVPVVAIYYEILKTITEDSEVHFSNLSALLDEHWQKFTVSEAHDQNLYLLNYCIRQINQGNLSYLAKSFEVYRSMIEKGILIRNDYLSPWTYKNIVSAGLRLGETDWVDRFINKYKSKLSEVYRENAFTYNFAKYNFHTKNYDVVLELLQKVEYDDIFYDLDSKSTLLKTYYELDELDALYSLMNSFRIFLRRKRGISDKHRQNFTNLIRFTRKASKLIPGDTKKATALLQEIQATKQVADINWLMEKVKGLMT